MNFEMRIVGFVLVAFVCSSSVKGAEEENYLVKLTDDDFEHKTQISTGMTTGDWLVIMAPQGECSQCERIEKVLKKVATEFRGRINVAVLDRDSSKLTLRRFKVKSAVVKFFRSGYMWEYKGMMAQSNIAEFITSGFERQNGYRPSKPVDFIDAWQEDYVKEMKAAYKEKRLPEKNALIVTLVGGSLALLILACILCPKSKSTDEEESAAKKQKSKKKN